MKPIFIALALNLFSSPPPIPELGTLKGTVTAALTTGAQPYTDRIALMRQISADGVSPYQYMLSAWIVPDAAGNFQIDDSPGTYYLVSVDELIQVGLHDLAAGVPAPLTANDLLPAFIGGPYVVVAHQTTAVDLQVENPPPPISIGVGN